MLLKRCQRLRDDFGGLGWNAVALGLLAGRKMEVEVKCLSL